MDDTFYIINTIESNTDDGQGFFLDRSICTLMTYHDDVIYVLVDFSLDTNKGIKCRRKRYKSRQRIVNTLLQIRDGTYESYDDADYYE
jgi:hypothetical protein